MDWAYPVDTTTPVVRLQNPLPVHVPDSAVEFLPSQLTDRFAAPDWHPDDHPMMPEVVARGRAPNVPACGFCHLPDGGGRPENASLAGLPARYIERQVRDFASGARRTSVPARAPPTLMAELSAHATEQDIEIAAAYFSRLAAQNRTQVVETSMVPRTHVFGWIRIVDEPVSWESIGQRIIEVPANLEDFEHRDARSRFTAYVPVGAVAAGKALIEATGSRRAVACSSCHGADLKGVGSIPSIAGRSPSYIARQLYDMQSGSRAGDDVRPMAAVVDRLHALQVLQIAAYLATLH
jgi:cytochrome c553